MKKLLGILVMVSAVLTACSDLGISGKDNLEKLEKMCDKINGDIASIQTIASALYDNNYVKSITSPAEGGKTTVTFNSGKTVTVSTGEAASCPLIGICKDSDGLYYWTLDGKWILNDEGGKLVAAGPETDGAMPRLRIEDGCWALSCGDGGGWQKLGEAEARDDVSLFKSVEYDDQESAAFILNDHSVLTFSWSSKLDVTFDKELPLTMDPNSTLEVGYTVEGASDNVNLVVESSADLEVETIADDKFSGKIRIKSGEIIDESSQVVVTVSDGANAIARILTFVPSADVFKVDPKEITVSGRGCNFELVILTNIGYKLTNTPEWIKEADVRKGDKPHTFVHVFNVEANTTTEARRGTVVFCTDTQVCVGISVTQNVAQETEAVPFHHRSLAMRFTADWCGYCPNMASALDLAVEKMPDRLEVLSVHCDGALVFGESSVLANQYGITGFPTGIIDGRKILYNDDSQEYMAQLVEQFSQETENTYSTASGIGISSSAEGRKLTAKVIAKFNYADSYKLTALLVEDNVVGYQADYASGSSYTYVHNSIVRMSLSKIRGESIITTLENESKEFTFTAEVPDKFNLQNMRIVVYIQRPFGSMEKIQSGNFGDYYVDNSASAKIGGILGIK